MMTRYFSSALIALALATIALPAQAKSSKRTIAFTSNVDGAVVTVTKLRSRSGKTLGSCTTPCELNLKPKNMGRILFTHPDYPNGRVNRQSVRDSLKSEETPIIINGEFGQSYSDRRALLQRKYDDVANAALAKGDADAKPYKRIPPRFPAVALERGSSGWCLVRLDVRIDGNVENVDAYDCSTLSFKAPSEASVAKWRYIPAIQNGAFIPSFGVTTSVKFRMMNERGEVALPARPQPELP